MSPEGQPAASQQETMKAWLIEYDDALRTMCVVIGTEQDAEDKAAKLPGDGRQPPWISGPYDFTIAVKP